MSSDDKLPLGWVWTTVGEITVNLDGLRVPVRAEGRQKRSGDYPYYGASGIIDTIDDYLFDGEHLLIAEDGANLLSRSTPIAFRASGRFWVNNHAHVVQLHGGLPLRFIEHYLNWINLQFYVTGTAQPKLNQVNLNRIRCPLPPLREQHRIVEVLEELLSDLDAGVAALERARANLKRYRAAILRAAVTGELTADWRAAHPNVEPASKLLDRILAERRRKSEVNAVGLKELPSGWCWSSLGQCFDVCVGATPSRSEARFWNGHIPWVSSGQVQFNRRKEPKEYITQAGLDNTSTQLNPKGSVLLGMIGEGKTRGQVSILDIEACNNQNCAAIWVSLTPIPPEYVFYWLWSRYDETRRGSAGNNQPAPNRTRVEAIPLPLPPLLEQEAIVAEVEQRISVIAAAENYIAASLKRASRLRQSILKEAFAGRLVPQDPKDEPASVLLDRIRQTRSSQNGKPKPRTRNPRQRELFE